MKNSIETIWKEGFLNERSLVAPKVNDFYNQKSLHLVDELKRMIRVNVIAIVTLAILFPIIHFFLDAFWQGAAASILLLLTAWYNRHQVRNLKTLDQGANSLDYLKSLDQWLKDLLSRSRKISRVFYPLCFLIAMSTLESAWSKNEQLATAFHRKFPDLIFVGNIPLVALIIAGVTGLLLIWFSDTIYKWDIRLMYGRIFDKLEATILEMEELKKR